MTTPTEGRSSYDAVIVGARCAGAATALLLARQGLRVLAVDRAAYGSDTLSTLALMRGGVLQLARWSVLDAVKAAGTPAIRLTTFHYADEERPIAIKSRDGVDALYAPRRTVLDPALIDAAHGAGAHVAFGVRLTGLVRSSVGRVTGVVIQDRSGRKSEIAAGIVVGADGADSTVARLVGAEPYRTGRHAGGVVYGYWSGLELTGYHWYFRPCASAGSIQTNGATLVFAAVPAQRFLAETRLDLEAGYHQVLREVSPALSDAVRRSQQVERFWGFQGRPGFMRQSWGPGWALVGDAGYYKDPITAHGITDALRDAELLAQAVVQGSDLALAGYQAARDELSHDMFEATDAIASFQWDLPAVEELHHVTSREMNREVKHLVALNARDVPA